MPTVLGDIIFRSNSILFLYTFYRFSTRFYRFSIYMLCTYLDIGASGIKSPKNPLALPKLHISASGFSLCPSFQKEQCWKFSVLKEKSI